MFTAALFTITKLWKQPRCPLPMNGSIKWNFIQQQSRMKICHLLVNGWNRRTSSKVKLVRCKRPKVTFSLRYGIDLIQIKKYYEKHSREVTYGRRSLKEGS
jgi:hypothetical protein